MEKKTLVRITANTLPVIRTAFAPVIANKLKNTAPEDRTWRLAASVGALAATDMIDGWLSRKAGPTKLGGWLDQLADKVLTGYSLKTLGENREIAKSHFYLKMARDTGVTAMRLYASHQNIDVDAQSLGKYKAVAEMATQTLAASPLSTKRYLIEASATASTALSTVSAVQYFHSYTQS